jgi:iron(III) transport system ATP-binding protein
VVGQDATRIEIEGVVKRFGTVQAVDGLELVIEPGRFVCLLGPSGCGKTTTLRMLAGLEFPDSGRIRSGGRVLSDGGTGAFVASEDRGMGLVFQSYALWPHMTVAQNIAFGLEMRRWSKARRDARVRELLDLLRIAGLGGRYPSELSGGQQQRVALARSLAPGAGVLLLDEPLSNLDAQLRLEMRAELKRLHEELGNTIVFVTHDQLEAMTMATDVAVMRDGRLQQYAPPLDVYRRPANVFVAGFMGSPAMNLFSLDTVATLEVARSVLRAVGARSPIEAGRTRTVGVRPEAIAVARHAAPASGEWSEPGRVEAILPTGAEWIVRVRAMSAVLFALSTRDPGLAFDDAVTLRVPVESFHLFDASGERVTADAPVARATSAAHA